MDGVLEVYIKRLEVRTAKAILDYHRVACLPQYAGGTDTWDYSLGYLNGDVNGLCIALREFDDMVSETDPTKRRYTLTFFDKAWAESRLAQESKGIT